VWLSRSWATSRPRLVELPTRGHPCEQISVRSPTLRVRFGLISNEFRREAFPQKNRAVTLKSNECAVWPAAPAPHPHNERLSTCVTSTMQMSSDEKRISVCLLFRATHVCGYAFSYREGPYYTEGASTRVSRMHAPALAHAQPDPYPTPAIPPSPNGTNSAACAPSKRESRRGPIMRDADPS
jgi:hypothetical protein